MINIIFRCLESRDTVKKCLDEIDINEWAFDQINNLSPDAPMLALMLENEIAESLLLKLEDRNVPITRARFAVIVSG